MGFKLMIIKYDKFLFRAGNIVIKFVYWDYIFRGIYFQASENFGSKIDEEAKITE